MHCGVIGGSVRKAKQVWTGSFGQRLFAVRHALTSRWLFIGTWIRRGSPIGKTSSSSTRRMGRVPLAPRSGGHNSLAFPASSATAGRDAPGASVGRCPG